MNGGRNDTTGRHMDVLSDGCIPPFIRKFLEERGEVFRDLERIIRGGNNRAYRLRTESGSYFLKAYFRHPQDPRDRLRAEYRFLEFCDELHIRAVPRPLAFDDAAGMALYSWVEGCPARLPVTEEEIAAACALLRELARRSSDARASRLDPAADACMSPRDHLLLARRRVDGLRAILAGCDEASLMGQARAFVEERLAPALEAAERRAEPYFATRRLEDGELLVSPSDFGFHNALRTRDGLVFVDFEYAGRDDPVKAVCDFLCQPEIPVPETSLPALTEALDVFGSAGLLERAGAFLPLHRVKWCCILLNDFKFLDAKRRAFASPEMRGEERLAGQLDKARRYLETWLRD